jgi:hypothetical protein
VTAHSPPSALVPVVAPSPDALASDVEPDSETPPSPPEDSLVSAPLQPSAKAAPTLAKIPSAFRRVTSFSSPLSVMHRLCSEKYKNDHDDLCKA